MLMVATQPDQKDLQLMLTLTDIQKAQTHPALRDTHSTATNALRRNESWADSTIEMRTHSNIWCF